VEEAEEEARYAMELAKDWELDMPLVYDWECLAQDYRTTGVDARLLTDCTKAFCDTVQAQGHTPMVYFNPSQSRKQMHLAELTGYDFWLAMYSDQMNYPYKVDMWQYTNEGSVPGISGNVDINLYFPYEDA
jgi:GH25 family lysozyme M1 (1,4-beta-N-acetylmuramidase)